MALDFLINWSMSSLPLCGMLTSTLTLSSEECWSTQSLIPVAKLSHVLGIWVLLHSTVRKILFPMEGDPWKVRVIMPLIHLFLLTSIILKANHNYILAWGIIEGFDMCEQFWEFKLIWGTHHYLLYLWCFVFLISVSTWVVCESKNDGWRPGWYYFNSTAR